MCLYMTEPELISLWSSSPYAHSLGSLTTHSRGFKSYLYTKNSQVIISNSNLSPVIQIHISP